MARNNRKPNNQGKSKKNRGNTGNHNYGNNHGRGPEKKDRTYDDYTSPAPEASCGKRLPSETANDPTWWTRNGELIKGSASIPQMHPVGGPVSILPADGRNYHFTDGQPNDYSRWGSPGIATFETFHGPGIAHSSGDAVNQAFLSRMEFIRSQVTPNINFDYADLAIISLALGECYAWYYNMRRVYSVVRTFSWQNKYVPRALCEALGFDYDDLRNNTVQFRNTINQFVLALGAFSVPNSNYYDRLEALYDNLFVDENAVKAQIYAFVPGILRYYDPTDENGSSLKTINLQRHYRGDERINLSTVRTICDLLINNLRNDDDIYEVFGLIRDPKTWGNNVYAIPQIGENYTVVPKMDEGMLHQIMNATLWWDVLYTDVTQEPGVGKGYIKYEPRVCFRASQATTDGEDAGTATIEKTVANTNNLLTWYGSEAIDPERVVYYTRFMSRAGSFPDAYDSQYAIQTGRLWSGGIEVLGRMHIYNLKYDASRTTEPEIVNTTITSLNVDFGVANNEARIAKLSAFNYHPSCWFIVHRASDKEVEAAEVIQQWENMAVIDSDVLDNIQWAALYSLWGIDQSSNYLGK